MANTCGACKWSHPLKEDLTKRICKGAPPVPVFIPTPQGMQQGMSNPIVEALDVRGCFVARAALLVP